MDVYYRMLIMGDNNPHQIQGTPATGTPATGTPATGMPATGMPATGMPATGTLRECVRN